jgi:hypothetical protein
MVQFYFHVRSDRQLAKDERGRQCSDHSAACAHAIQSIPSLLGKYLQAGANTHVSTQICDDRHRTVAVIRGTVILEKW